QRPASAPVAARQYFTEQMSKRRRRHPENRSSAPACAAHCPTVAAPARPRPHQWRRSLAGSLSACHRGTADPPGGIPSLPASNGLLLRLLHPPQSTARSCFISCRVTLLYRLLIQLT